MKPVTADTRVQTWVIFGPSGVGKSSLAATAPRPAFLDSNKGLLSVAGRVGLEHVHGEDINKFSDLDRALKNFKGQTKHRWDKKYGSIVFDHFDDIQAITMEELGRKRHERDERKDIDEAEQKDWGTMATRLKRVLRGFKTVPIHKILICGQMEDRENGQLIPSLQGQLKSALPYFVDHVLYLRANAKTGVRYIHLDPTEEFFAKTRAHWLTPAQRKIQVDFNDTKALTKLFELIAAGPKGTTAAKRK